MHPLVVLFALHALSKDNAASSPTFSSLNTGPQPGQGGVQKQLSLPGRNGEQYLLTWFNDGTRLVQTFRATFFVRPPNLREPIKILHGTPAAIAIVVSNYPE